MKKRTRLFRVAINTPNIPIAPVRFAFDMMHKRGKELGLNRKVVVHIHTTKICDWYACAYRCGGKVTLRINRRLAAHDRVQRYPRFKDMPTFWTRGLEETIVYAAGHEFGHSLGYDGTPDGEVSCERFAARCVVAWRDRQYESPACLI